MNKAQSTVNLLSKSEMLSVLQEAKEILESGYVNTADGKDAGGKVLSRRTAQNKRSIYKNKLCILYLLEELLQAVPNNYRVKFMNSQLGFNRLTEV